jgi:hypothetical protein
VQHSRGFRPVLFVKNKRVLLMYRLPLDSSVIQLGLGRKGGVRKRRPGKLEVFAPKLTPHCDGPLGLAKNDFMDI